MSFYYCLSLTKDTEESCILFENLDGIFKSGSENLHPEIGEKKVFHGTIQLRNGITKPGKIWEWVKTGIEETSVKPIDLRDIEIALYGPEKTICRWVFKGAYPISLEVASEQGKILLGRLEFVFGELVAVYPTMD